jgi:uncharacterized protein (TIGR00369 family)
MSATERTANTSGLEEHFGAPKSKVVTWYDPAVLTGAGAELTGRELLQAVIDGQLPPPSMANLIGAELVSVGDGEALFRCSPDGSTYNPIGLVHGGVLCTLLDFAAGAAVQTLLEPGAIFSSIEIKVSFLKPLLEDAGEIEIHGRVLRIGHRVAFAEAHARDHSGELVGHATTSLALSRRSPEQQQ